MMDGKYIKRLIIISLCYFMTSCSPQMHIVGGVMRKFNQSHNKYGPKKPYIKKNIL